MLSYEILPLLDGVGEIIDVSPGATDLARQLRIPAHVRHTRYGLAEAEELEIGTASVLLALLGDAPAQTDPADLAAVLARLRPGGRAILLLGWPIGDLPYHRLIGPLVDARCQVIEAVPLDRVTRHGAHCALIVECVNRLAPLRSYLTDLGAGPAGRPEPNDGDRDDLRTVLRVTNEYLLADLVARPMRQRLREQEAQLAELRRQLAEQTARLAELESPASS